MQGLNSWRIIREIRRHKKFNERFKADIQDKQVRSQFIKMYMAWRDMHEDKNIRQRYKH